MRHLAALAIILLATGRMVAEELSDTLINDPRVAAAYLGGA